MREPYTRLRCSSCKQLVNERQLDYNPMQVRVHKAFKDSKKPEKAFHIRTYTVGSGRRGVIGCRMEQESCGPVEEEEVGIQEQWVEELVELQRKWTGSSVG